VRSNPKLRVQDSETAKRISSDPLLRIYHDRPSTGNGAIPNLGLKQYYYLLVILGIMDRTTAATVCIHLKYIPSLNYVIVNNIVELYICY